eukprot:UN00565
MFIIYSRPPPRTDGWRLGLRTDGRVGLDWNKKIHTTPFTKQKYTRIQVRKDAPLW